MTVSPPIQTWPPQLARAVSGSFQLAVLNLTAQPLFSMAPSPFSAPLDQRWVTTLQSPPLPQNARSGASGLPDRPSYFEIEGRIARLKGIGGRLRLSDPVYTRPQYDATAAVTVSKWSGGRSWSGGRGWSSGALPPYVTVDETANAGATSLKLRGLPASIARVLRIGDRWEARPNGAPSLFGNLYMTVDDVNSNADGKLRIVFEPGLRVGLNAGDQIVLRNPTTVFSAIDDKQGAVTRSLNTGSFGLSLIEVLPWDA